MDIQSDVTFLTGSASNGMKIGIILRKIKRKDGIQQKALGLAQELKKRGHAITVYTYEYEKDLASSELTNGLKIISLPHPTDVPDEKLFGFLSRPSYLMRWRRRNVMARRLAHRIDRDTDLLSVHSHNTYPVSYYFKKEIKDVPCVWEVASLPFAGWKFSTNKEANPDFYVNPLKRFFYYVMDRIEIRKFIRPHRIVVFSARNRAHIKRLVHKDAILAQAGIDIERFAYKQKQPLQDKKIRVLLTGTLFTYRRFEDAIEAVKILCDKGFDVTLQIVGAYEHRPDYYAKLQELITNLGLGARVSFLGFVPESQLAEVYRKGDVVISPAIKQDAGLPFTVAEAMACGTPLITTRTSGGAEIFTDRVNALFVDPKSPRQIADAVGLLFKNPELYLLLSQNGRNFVEYHLTQRQYADAMEQIFKKEIESPEADR